jgi:hypothetical protein
VNYVTLAFCPRPFNRLQHFLIEALSGNYGHYGRLEVDGITEWHPTFLTLATTLKG